jgi:hypothetical protein
MLSRETLLTERVERCRIKDVEESSDERSQGVLLVCEPITTIDPRLSDSDAVPTGWEGTHDMLERLVRAWATRWDGQWRCEVRDGLFPHKTGGETLVFSVTPTRILAFVRPVFCQRCHQC